MTMDCTQAFRQWWDQLTREGDPLRVGNLGAKGFTAGWYACEKAAREARMAAEGITEKDIAETMFTKEDQHRL